MTSFLNIFLDKLKEQLESFKKSQNSFNDQTKREKKIFSNEIQKIKLLTLKTQNVKCVYEKKLDILDKELIPLNGEKENESQNVNKQNSSKNVTNQLSLKNILQFFENSINSSKAPNQIQNSFNQFKNDITILYTNKDELMETLKVKSSKLQELNIIFSSQIELYERENNKMKFCTHCHQNYHTKTNEEENCIYHPGVLKYYSCRKCGGDEYYTCCMKCNKCSTGCKKSKHISEI